MRKGANISKDVLVFNTHKIRHIIWVLETWRNLLIKMKENQDIPSEYIKNAELITIAKEPSFVKYENGVMKLEFNSKTDDIKYKNEKLDAENILHKILDIISNI